MKSVRTHALRLRIQGKSYNEIRKEIPVAKSTLSLWLRDVVLSDTARARLHTRVKQGTAQAFLRRNKLQTILAEHRAKEARTVGQKRIHALTAHDLLLAGTILYWAEGYKRLKIRDGKERMGHNISFVNSDSEMIAIFVQFLREVLTVPPDKIRLYMRLYAHINEQGALRYWMRATGLPRNQFHKTTYLVSGASKGKRPFNRLPWGTLQIEVCDTQKFHYLMGLIEGVKNKLKRDIIVPLLG